MTEEATDRELLLRILLRIDLLYNYMQVVTQQLGLRDKVSGIDEQWVASEPPPVKRKSFDPEADTNPGFKNGE